MPSNLNLSNPFQRIHNQIPESSLITFQRHLSMAICRDWEAEVRYRHAQRQHTGQLNMIGTLHIVITLGWITG